MRVILTSDVHTIADLHGLAQASGARVVSSHPATTHVVCEVDEHTLSAIQRNPSIKASIPRKISAA